MTLLNKIKLFFTRETFMAVQLFNIKDILGSDYTLVYFVSNKNNTRVQITRNIPPTGVIGNLNIVQAMTPNCYKYCKPIINLTI